LSFDEFYLASEVIELIVMMIAAVL